MRILVEPSDYTLRNAGDMAMLEVAVTRLGALWPQASIQVFSDTPEIFPRYCPNVTPLPTTGRRAWFAPGPLARRLSSVLPGATRLERGLRRQWPALMRILVRSRLKNCGNDGKDLEQFLCAVARADLLIVSGMGGLTDAFPDYARELLDVLGLATRRGRPTAMMSQGMGPLSDPGLRAQAKAVLPRVDLIALREEHAGRPLLRSLGVSDDRIITTGDDAIEMAYRFRSDRLGTGLGVNLRASSYSGVDAALVQRLRPALHEAARRHKAPLLPVPISRVPGEADADTILELLHGYDDRTDGGIGIDAPLKVIAQIQRCRVVVTGSYHAGVFALSQGTPVVGVARSTYYVDKFVGLARQFGSGCVTVLADGSDLAGRLLTAIDRVWDSAFETRPGLLAAAAQQIKLSQAAYRRVYELVECRAATARVEVER